MSSTIVTALDRVAKSYAVKAKIREYRNNPTLWAHDRLGIDFWSKQDEIGLSLVANKKTAVKSCHDAGKTFSAAVFVCWWLDVYADEDCLVVTTAPTAHQVNKILWEYIRKMHAKHGLRGTVSEASEWKSDSRNVIGFGRKPADANDHGFQGQHHEYTLVVIDEGCGIRESLFTGAEAITTTDECRILAIGNPDDPATEFGRIFKSDPTWKKITISAFDTPNFTGEKVDDQIYRTLISRNWVEEKKLSWGVGSNRWRSKVLGEFPTTSIDTLFPPALLDSTLDNFIVPDEEAQGTLGVDVARYGDDLSVAILDLGGNITIQAVWDSLDLMSLSEKIHRLACELGVRAVHIDGTGMGAGVVDRVSQLSVHSPYVVVEMIGSSASPNYGKWINARAYWHDNLKHKMLKGALCLPNFLVLDEAGLNNKKLYEELEGIQYTFHTKGGLQIEGKSDMRKRGIKSPDFSDALTYACADVNYDSPTSGLQLGDTYGVDATELINGPYAISPY